ncbi:hypothetical protein BO71DRAFT_238877 [Aspergillus ellipticus CBS 707.79]|uniref:Uncharacterized protein n=1 Tax=Aspergillus ellipticus CBS 707.79 TaxID=1448320 RepID=A0A319ET60_9EURO|nr:hypothetical protein BO71DRAFT_238877 [Aspergillus ellipticus CBS 707.79]
MTPFPCKLFIKSSHDSVSSRALFIVDLSHYQYLYRIARVIGMQAVVKFTILDHSHIESDECEQELPDDPTSAVIEGSLVLKAPFSPSQANGHRRWRTYIRSILFGWNGSGIGQA